VTGVQTCALPIFREHKPKSVYELARILERDLKNVNQDLKLLSEIGLVALEKRETDKKRIVPHVDYSKILLEIPV
jgi:predicted transcriptional regulator